MPTFHKGTTGSVTLGGAAVATKTVNMKKRNRLAEITNSGSSGNAEWQATVKEGDFTVKLVWDSTNLPDTDLSADAGDSIAVVGNIGDSGKTQSFTGVIEELTLDWDNEQGVVMATITGKTTGAITDPVT